MSLTNAPQAAPVAKDESSDAAATDSFVERLFGAALGAQEVQAVYIGLRLGWYTALAAHGPHTSAELAEQTGTDERYAREWLEHQAVCGYLAVDSVAAPPTERRFSLPAAHVPVLAAPDHPAYVAPLADIVAGLGRHVDRVVDAYRTGGGVAWADFGPEVRDAQAAANRPLFLTELGGSIIPAIHDVHEALLGAGRVADVGCGGGWSAIGIALAYPDARVDGFDIDEPTVELARRNAEAAGVAGRVQFHLADANDVPEGDYDAVFAFECVHDVPDPVKFLASMLRLAGDRGAVIVMDERVADTFAAPGDEVERIMYGYSIMCCLPDGMAHGPSAATGTVMRRATLAGSARGAGFDRVDVLPIDHDFFRFYRLERQ